ACRDRMSPPASPARGQPPARPVRRRLSLKDQGTSCEMMAEVEVLDDGTKRAALDAAERRIQELEEQLQNVELHEALSREQAAAFCAEAESKRQAAVRTSELRTSELQEMVEQASACFETVRSAEASAVQEREKAEAAELRAAQAEASLLAQADSLPSVPEDLFSGPFQDELQEQLRQMSIQLASLEAEMVQKEEDAANALAVVRHENAWRLHVSQRQLEDLDAELAQVRRLAETEVAEVNERLAQALATLSSQDS
ncbi:unnamed protein product, partial [Polarella glacialis]